MFFCDEIEKICRKYNKKKIYIFVDMDGVIADYRYGEGKNILNNVADTYLKKRPIETTIGVLKTLSNKKQLKLCILSSCFYKEQVDEKRKWLKLNAPFFKEKNLFFTISKDFEERKQKKIDKIKEISEENEARICILIDDTHEILEMGINQLGEKFIPFHVSTIID